MILDTLENARKYESTHPRFKNIFDFLLETDLSALPLGKIELEGNNLVVNVVDLTGKPENEAKMESHNEFIDIQIPVGAVERMGWIARTDLKEESAPYNPEKDVTFYNDKASTFLDVKPFEFVIFFPEDAHQPGIASTTHRKIIAKIKA